MIARVIVDIAHTNLDKVFDYRIPENMEPVVGGRVVVPFGHTETEGYVLEITSQTDYPPEKMKEISRVIEDYAVFTPAQIRLAYCIRAHYHTTLAFALRLMIPAELRKERVRIKTIEIASVTTRFEEDYEFLRAGCFTRAGILRAKNKLATIERLNQEKKVPCAVLDRISVKKLEEQGYVQIQKEERERSPYAKAELRSDTEVSLNERQKEACNEICVSIEEANGGRFLLHGVTGSGKTEVYMHCAQFCLENNKTAIILVPEISLTPQLYEVFRARFGNCVALFHSGLSAGEKYDEWRRVLSGEAKILLGARSAIFMPLKNLGMIVIDEEHEASYRSENHPTYSAHEIAYFRSKIEGTTIVLASATPQIETYFLAKKGFYRLLELPTRVKELALPKMHIIDMRQELKKGNRNMISGPLYEAMTQCLRKKEQVLLFINRRGYSSFVLCRGCGYVRMCTHCDVPLKYHKADETLRCHQCGRSWKYEKICPQCGQPYLKHFGVGTEQIEAQVQRLFPQARTLRMDFDTTRGKDAHEKIYTAFRRGEADILVGTQMIAKGFDFENVTLVGIVAADTMMMEDYRAEERMFTLIEQAAGRAGRSRPGNVFVQTYQPAHYAIMHAKDHDYQGFFMDELVHRKVGMLPPYSVVFRILFVHEEDEKAKKACFLFENMLKEMLKSNTSDIILMIPSIAPIGRIQGKTRYQILLKIKNNKNRTEIRKKIFELWDREKAKGVQIAIDCNP